MTTTFDRQLDSARVALKVGLGVGPFLAGLDKFTNLLADWTHYVSPLAAAVLPVRPQAFLYVVGVIEMAVGLAILTRWTRLGSYVAMVWLLCIALNLLAAGFFDIAVRDLEIAIAAYTLARLTEVQAASERVSSIGASATAAPARIGVAA